jgi:ABC-type methionine transport system ATPase subunit
MLHIKDINLKVAQGERAICDPSGAGQSALPCRNGLEEYQDGCVIIDCVELTNDPPLPVSPTFGATLFSFLLEA